MFDVLDRDLPVTERISVYVDLGGEEKLPQRNSADKLWLTRIACTKSVRDLRSVYIPTGWGLGLGARVDVDEVVDDFVALRGVAA